jgi:membrane protein implicated in regulation of membrane protease activity
MFHGLYLGMIVSGVLCALYIVAGRRWVRAHFDLKGASRVTSNTDSVLGAKGLVLARIAPHQPGRVRVNQEEWRAVLAEGVTLPFEVGTEITVTGLDGVTLQVR